MTEQELDLLQLAAGTVAELGAGPAKVVRRHVVHSTALADVPHHSPDETIFLHDCHWGDSMQPQSDLLERAARARREDRLDEAHRAYAEAVRVFRESDERLGLIRALKGLGQIERDRGNVVAALANYEEATSIARRESNPLLLAHTVRHVGDILRQLARTAEAKECYTEALGLYRAHADAPPLDLANAIRGMAVLKDDLGETDAALALWEEAYRLYASVGVHAGVTESKARQAAAARRKQSR